MRLALTLWWEARAHQATTPGYTAAGYTAAGYTAAGYTAACLSARSYPRSLSHFFLSPPSLPPLSCACEQPPLSGDELDAELSRALLGTTSPEKIVADWDRSKKRGSVSMTELRQGARFRKKQPCAEDLLALLCFLLHACALPHMHMYMHM